MTINAVIFDWAGTTVDFGSVAPVLAFKAAFNKYGISVNDDEIRQDMGMAKRDHIEKILNLVDARINLQRDKLPSTDTIYQAFEDALDEILAGDTNLLAGVVGAVNWLRSQGIMIGSTTGYTSAMLTIVSKRTESLGYLPDVLVTPDMVGSGRPTPAMINYNLEKLAIENRATVIKIGDTVVDIQEARNADVIPVGVIVGSSLLGYSAEAWADLDVSAQNEAIQIARSKFITAGAQYVINDMSELPALIELANKVEVA